MTIVDTGSHVFARHRFAILFGLLFCVLLIPPYFEEVAWVGTIWRGLFTCVLLWTLYTIGGSRKILGLAILLLIPTVGSTWLADHGQERIVLYLDNITNIVYFGLVCGFMAHHILTERKVTLEVIFAAMCLYMIMAVLWAAIYTNLELFYEDAFTFHGLPASEAGIADSELYSVFVYYSFVTLSTLGYGDVLPVHRTALNWAAMEAMIGQFYIAVIIARLVSVYTVEGEGEQLDKQ